MSFQAYLDTIQQKTGKSPEQFRALAAKKGLLQPHMKAADVLAWLKADFGLGHGHAMAVYAAFKRATEPQLTVVQQVEQHFTGARIIWRKPYRQLLTQIENFGADISVKPMDSYISVLRDGKKFAIVQASVARLEIGIKLRGVAPNDRLMQSRSWNVMVKHRVRIASPKEIDAELVDWLRLAYDRL